jgi:hypothetical protein
LLIDQDSLFAGGVSAAASGCFLKNFRQR